jgi:hypothetical protein
MTFDAFLDGDATPRSLHDEKSSREIDHQTGNIADTVGAPGRDR